VECVSAENHTFLVAGAIAAAQSSRLSIQWSSFVSNCCRGRCSVLRIWDIKLLSVNDTEFLGNRAESGGAIPCSRSEVEIVDSYFARNEASMVTDFESQGCNATFSGTLFADRSASHFNSKVGSAENHGLSNVVGRGGRGAGRR
jgi:hypothetical protein